MAKTTKVMVVVNGTPIHGTYEGGAYIDLSFEAHGDAFDVINVFDYATDKPTIENTSAAVRQEIREWAEAAGESLDHDLREHAIAVGRIRP